MEMEFKIEQRKCNIEKNTMKELQNVIFLIKTEKCSV